MGIVRFIVRAFAVLLLVGLVGAGVAYYVAGRMTAPQIRIDQPAAMVGQSSVLELTVDSPPAQLSAVTVDVEQNGRMLPVLAIEPASDTSLNANAAGPVHITRTIGKRTTPELQPGRATIVATASRPVLRGLRTVSSRATRDVQVRFDPPRIAVASMHHHINQGGSEMVIYRVAPADVESGVRVGAYEYPGFAASGAGASGDETLKVAFFALLYDQDANTAIELYARDDAGNEARAEFDHRIFPKRFRQSRIDVDDSFLGRVVPQILQQATELKPGAASPTDLLPAFLKINGDLRRLNAENIAGFARKTSSSMLWKEPFRQLSNSQVESGFADYRTYFYGGKEIDKQVHLGFDLAVTANVLIVAANRGTVLHAGYLGIYGNCLILDHGMGVQSLYAHLSSIDVREGQNVEQGATLGRSGQTGLAGGDHLHFTMLVNGQPVNPTEWWDPHWVDDRVRRKLREAGSSL